LSGFPRDADKGGYGDKQNQSLAEKKLRKKEKKASESQKNDIWQSLSWKVRTRLEKDRPVFPDNSSRKRCPTYHGIAGSRPKSAKGRWTGFFLVSVMASIRNNESPRIAATVIQDGSSLHSGTGLYLQPVGGVLGGATKDDGLVTRKKVSRVLSKFPKILERRTGYKLRVAS